MKGISNIKSLVLSFCLTSSFTRHSISRPSLLGNSSGDTKNGPIGPKVSNDLPRLNWGRFLVEN